MDTEAEIGRRIRKFREAAGRTAAELAEALKVSASAVSRAESGQRSVKAWELNEIGAFLGISPLAVLRPDSLLARLAVIPRNGEDGSGQSEAVLRLMSLLELHVAISENGYPTTCNIAEARQVRKRGWLDHANALAKWAGERLWRGDGPDGLSAADGVETRLESLSAAIEAELGVDVMIDDLGDDGPRGISLVDSEFSLIMINSQQTRARALFMLAHELGHVLSGHGKMVNVHQERIERSGEERLANAFAAELLIPQAAIRKASESRGLSANFLAEMLLRFGVSYEALIYCLNNLQIINAAETDRLKENGRGGLIRNLLESCDEEDRRIADRLRAVRDLKPSIRPPTLLAIRALRAALDGVCSATPLAALLDIEVDDAIDIIDTILDIPTK